VHNLSPQVVTKVVNTGTAAGITTVDLGTIDTSGFTGLRAVVLLGAIAATGVATLKAAHGEAADGSDAVALPTAVAAAADDDDNKSLILDIYKPRERYVKLTLERTTANTTVLGAIVELYNATHVPVTADATVATETVVAEPLPA
jgi:hypothetical protein